MQDNKRKTIHIVPHTHWDREWYMPFELHRYYLVRLMDSLIEHMENNPEYTYFHLDGQVIVIEDYLSIKPHMKDRLLHLIHTNRIQIGPWYVLQDEYLTSGEANVRNMLIGLDICRQLSAEPVMTGYFPDSFGNISQIPQILNGFGISTAVFGRGGKDYSEINWVSEDGSSVCGVWLSGWYHNALQLPVEDELSLTRFEKILETAKATSVLDDYLGMNGSDHQPVQLNLTEAIEVANKVTSDNVRVKHSNLKEYLKIVESNCDRFPNVRMELAGQNGHGLNLLISTASARIYLKQLNRIAQNCLERQAEPLSAMSWLFGRSGDNDFLRYAWKKLLENHAHDSICGCSVDEVHREMVTRFHSSIQVSGKIRDESAKHVAANIDTRNIDGYPFAVFNTSIYTRSGRVSGYIDLPESENVQEIRLVDQNGNNIPFEAVRMPHTFTYDLPDDAFRVVTYMDRWQLSFNADHVPAMGYRVYSVQGGAHESVTPMQHTGNTAENDSIRLVIANNGSLTIVDKISGRIFEGLNLYEDSGDSGDEYLYFQAGEDIATTADCPARISVDTATHDYVAFCIKQSLAIPKGYDRTTKQRLKENASLEISTIVTLPRKGKCVTIVTTVNNNACNHRLRAVFPNTVNTNVVLADGQFDIVKRTIQTGPLWKNRTNEQRLNAFVALKDEDKILMVATRGLHEYEVARDNGNTLAVTLLRSVDILGDWGEFPTPEAQCLGKNTVEYEILVGESDEYSHMVKEAYNYHSGEMSLIQIKAKQAGKLPPLNSLCSLQGEGVWSSAFKVSEDNLGLILRLNNYLSNINHVDLTIADCFEAVYTCNLLEQPHGDNLLQNGKVSLAFRPKEIKTLLLLPKK